MILGVSVQLWYFCSTIIAGLIVGILFDIYGIVRGINNPNKIMVAISDILFWVFEALVVFVFLIFTNNGDLRYYTFIGMILGIFSYFKMFSKITRAILIRSIKVISKIFSIIINIICIPFKFIIHIYGLVSINVNEKATEINRKRIKKKLENKNKQKLKSKKGKRWLWKNKAKEGKIIKPKNKPINNKKVRKTHIK
ncbi:MAG: spore cortex biosynthesis protein YabQ [Clostridium sp.]